MDEELIEYALVNERGKIHEALLRTTARPFDLQIALLLLRYEPYKEGLFTGFDRESNGLPAKRFEPEACPINSRLNITVKWKDGENDKEAPLESWILDLNSGKAVKPTFWLFNGFPDPKTMKYWKAEHESNTIGIFLDDFSPINFPHEGSWNDENWRPHKEALPDVETPIEIIIRPVEK